MPPVDAAAGVGRLAGGGGTDTGRRCPTRPATHNVHRDDGVAVAACEVWGGVRRDTGAAELARPQQRGRALRRVPRRAAFRVVDQRRVIPPFFHHPSLSFLSPRPATPAARTATRARTSVRRRQQLPPPCSLCSASAHPELRGTMISSWFRGVVRHAAARPPSAGVFSASAAPPHAAGAPMAHSALNGGQLWQHQRCVPLGRRGPGSHRLCGRGVWLLAERARPALTQILCTGKCSERAPRGRGGGPTRSRAR